jgi:hypothetical protein
METNNRAKLWPQVLISNKIKEFVLLTSRKEFGVKKIFIINYNTLLVYFVILHIKRLYERELEMKYLHWQKFIIKRRKLENLLVIGLLNWKIPK